MTFGVDMTFEGDMTYEGDVEQNHSISWYNTFEGCMEESEGVRWGEGRNSYERLFPFVQESPH